MLPVIDLASDGSAALDRAFAEIGFAFVVNHGVPEATQQRARAATRAFHALPAAEKSLVARQPGRYRGYIAPQAFSQDRASGRTILYETFIAGAEVTPDDPVVAATGGLIAPNLWPAQPADFRAAILEYWEAMEGLGRKLLDLTAAALGQDPVAFRRHFQQPLSNISLLHYPPSPAGQRPADARPHRDTNVLTILLPGEVGGLEVQRRDESWFAVPPHPGGFVVNIGNMLEHWSGGRFRSTWHRVHPPEGVDRYSLAWFLAPDAETEVAPLDGSGAGEPPMNAGRDLAAFIAQFDGGPAKV